MLNSSLGQVVVHFANVFISSLVATEAVQNPCVLYFLNIVVDTTIGTSCHPSCAQQRTDTSGVFLFRGWDNLFIALGEH